MVIDDNLGAHGIGGSWKAKPSQSMTVLYGMAISDKVSNVNILKTFSYNTAVQQMPFDIYHVSLPKHGSW